MKTLHIPIKRTLWLSIGGTLLFNGLLFACLLLRPGNSKLVILIDNCAQAIGPFLILSLFLFSVFHARKFSLSQKAVSPTQKARRKVYIFLGLGLSCFTLGQFLWSYYVQILHQPPTPTLADVALLSAYPFLGAGVLLFPTRSLIATHRVRILLDSLIVMAAILTFSWYFILGPTIQAGSNTLLGMLVTSAYPVADLVLISCLVSLTFRAHDHTFRPVLLVLWLAFAIVITGDTIYDYQTIHGTYVNGQVLDVVWPFGYMLVGVALHLMRLVSWKQDQVLEKNTLDHSVSDPPVSSVPKLWHALLPLAFFPAVAILVFYTSRLSGNGVLTYGVFLGAAVLLGLVFLRQILATRETILFAKQTQQLNEELEKANEHMALATIDALTNIPNHRALVGALDQELERSLRYQHSFSVLFFDIDHFKALNDGYGHSVGDVVLREFASLVPSVLRTVDTVGRWGGEEFIAILPETDERGALAAAERVRSSISAHLFPIGGGVRLTCSLGVATFPAHATDRESLVNAADHAMYAAKKLGRNQVRSISDPVIPTLEEMSGKAGLREETALVGVVEALSALLEARDGYTGQHTQRVGKLTLQLALKVGLDASEAHMIELAGRLHDVGKIGIPDAVLHKPSRLTEEEWELMRKHPTLGAEVVSRIPALRALAVVIRSHHERWDGTGYPDKLVGDAIPLGARIVAVVDAYEAMTTDRPYQKARSVQWALEELHRCAGTQFDRQVVEALDEVLTAVSKNKELVGAS